MTSPALPLCLVAVAIFVSWRTARTRWGKVQIGRLARRWVMLKERWAKLLATLGGGIRNLQLKRGSRDTLKPMARRGKVTTGRCLIAAGLFAAAVVLAYFVFPQDPSFPSQPGAWSVWIDNRWFLAVIRTVAVFVALYVLVSVIALTATGRWLVKFGAASADEAGAEDDVAKLQLANTRLETRLAESQLDAQRQRHANLDAQRTIQIYEREFERLTESQLDAERRLKAITDAQ